MVYESDFYTTRRPYRPSSYSVTKRSRVDWEKVPFVPRPSLVADPVTAFGRREPMTLKKPSILSPEARANIKPSLVVLNSPIKDYYSPRDLTREKVLSAVRKHDLVVEAGGEVSALTENTHMDKVLPRLHKTTLPVYHKTRVFYSNYATH